MVPDQVRWNSLELSRVNGESGWDAKVNRKRSEDGGKELAGLYDVYLWCVKCMKSSCVNDLLKLFVGMSIFLILVQDYISHTIHVWYIYIPIYHHLPLKNQPNVGKHTIPMDPMGIAFKGGLSKYPLFSTFRPVWPDDQVPIISHPGSPWPGRNIKCAGPDCWPPTTW